MRVLVLALAIALQLAPGGSVAAEYTIVVSAMKFGPVPAGLRAGDTVVWRNDDMFRHTATARDGSFDLDLPPGTSASVVAGEPGSIEFFCKFHPGMTGTLVVGP